MIAQWNGKPLDNTEQYETLWIYDLHAEYTYKLEKDQETWHVSMIYSYYDLESLVGEDLIDKIDEAVGKVFDDYEKGYWFEQGHVWRIRGKYKDLYDCFIKFAADVMGGPIGADDDIYDYWPNAFGMAQQMAEDLDRLYPAAKHKELLKKMYETMVEQRGRVSEFISPWDDPDSSPPDYGDDPEIYRDKFYVEYSDPSNHDKFNAEWDAYVGRIKQLQEHMLQLAASWEGGKQ